MPLWIGEVWECACGAINAVLRKRCRFCGKKREEAKR